MLQLLDAALQTFQVGTIKPLECTVIITIISDPSSLQWICKKHITTYFDIRNAYWQSLETAIPVLYNDSIEYKLVSSVCQLFLQHIGHFQ